MSKHRMSPHSAPASRRLDLQGLRMVAVVGVVLNHLDPSLLPGGVVRIDVFFVLSGYLVTSRLVRAAEGRSPLARLAGFYRSRVRRILPAALACLAVTTAVAYAVFVPSRAHAIGTDALWAVFALANWHFAAVGTDYFQSGLATSPVQHFWSLAVEEQFYLLWPVLVLAVGGLWLGRRGVAALSALVIAASLAYGLWYTPGHPAAAYFSTFTRAWEIAAGALLACVVPSLRQRGARFATVLSCSGLAVVAAAFVWTPTDRGLPVPWAIPAVLGSLAIIAAGALGDTRGNVVLTNPVSVWIGDISYSVYLWHFPAIVVGAALIGERNLYFYVCALGATVALSLLSYHLIEEPFQRGRWALLAGWLPKSVAAVGSAAVACVFFVARPMPVEDRDEAIAAKVGHAADPDPEAVEPTPEWSERLREALALDSFPDVDLDHMYADMAADSPFWQPEGLWDDDAGVIDWSVLSADRDPDKTVLLLGDSMAWAYYPMVRDALEPLGWTVVMTAVGMCPASFVPVMWGNGDDGWTRNEGCDFLSGQLASVLERLRPAVVLTASAENSLLRVLDSSGQAIGDTEQAYADYGAGLVHTIGLATSVGARTVVLSPPPEGKYVAECMVPGATPARCAFSPSERWQHLREVESDAAEQAGAAYLDLLSFFCDGSRCPGILRSDGVWVPVKYDYTHLTAQLAEALAPQFAAAMDSRGLLARP